LLPNVPTIRVNHASPPSGATTAEPLTAWNTTLSAVEVVALLFAVLLPIHYALQYQPLVSSIAFSLRDAALYSFILIAALRLDLIRITLCYLALPYLIFILLWLNTPAAIMAGIIFIASLLRTLPAISCAGLGAIRLHQLFAFCLILAWVGLSGIGSNGYTSPDLAIHHDRLRDLVDLPWPVHYGENRNLVYYLGFFLPAAVTGKAAHLFSRDYLDVAMTVFHIWAVIGTVLAVRWLGQLGHWRFSLPLVIVFMLFGPLDILAVNVFDYLANIPWQSALDEIRVNSDYLDFRSTRALGFFTGNYLSNSFQLFWSPQQVIASWLGISVLTYLYQQKQMAPLVFCYALLFLWTPFAMIALLPFVLAATLPALLHKPRTVFTFENTAGASLLAIVFALYYLGGHAGETPIMSTLGMLSLAQAPLWIIFLLCGWGIYAVALAPSVRLQDSREKQWFVCLVIALLLLPLLRFGAYNDLFCRGSAPLMFLLLVYWLRATRLHLQRRSAFMLSALVVLWLAGSASALIEIDKALGHTGEPGVARQRLVDYVYAGENLGPDDTLFNRYLRRSP